MARIAALKGISKRTKPHAKSPKGSVVYMDVSDDERDLTRRKKLALAQNGYSSPARLKKKLRHSSAPGGEQAASPSKVSVLQEQRRDLPIASGTLRICIC